MKNLYILFVLIGFQSNIAQVGINNSNPNALLDISASNPANPSPEDGLLIPRVTAFSTTNPGADQDGMLVYLTQIDGTNEPGFYSWDNANILWQSLKENILGDADFFIDNTTNQPSSINDNIYTLGKMAIGKSTTSNYTLDLESNSNRSLRSVLTTQNDANHYGFYNELNGSIDNGLSSGNIYGSFTAMNTTSRFRKIAYYANFPDNTGRNYGALFEYEDNQEAKGNSGVQANFSGNGTGAEIGYANRFSGNVDAGALGNGFQTGLVNSFVGNGTGRKTGIQSNFFNTVSGTMYGMRNLIGGVGQMYGSNNFFFENAIGNQIGTKNTFDSEDNNLKAGLRNEFTASSLGTHFGLQNFFESENTIYENGIFNKFNSTGSGVKVGVQNEFDADTSADQIGINSIFTGNGDGVIYGSYTGIISSGFGNKFGNYINISSVSGGLHYGVFSNVTKLGSYAGYFLGRISVGTTTTNNYLLPASRGLDGQIIRTDANGNLSWSDSALSNWNRTGSLIELTNSTDDLNFTSDQTSLFFPPTIGAPSSMMYLFSSGFNNSDRMIFSQSPVFSNWGLMYQDTTDSFRFLTGGNDRVVVNLQTGANPLVVTGIAQATAFQSATTTYPDYVFEKYFDGTSKINPAYTFKTLDEHITFIKNNGHLQGVKSYKEVAADGMQFNLTETTINNLEKVEELFIYAYELKQENKYLKETQEALIKRIEKLEELINN